MQDFFIITAQETVYYSVRVEADTLDEARKKVRNGEVKLTNDNITEKDNLIIE